MTLLVLGGLLIALIIAILITRLSIRRRNARLQQDYFGRIRQIALRVLQTPKDEADFTQNRPVYTAFELALKGQSYDSTDVVTALKQLRDEGLVEEFQHEGHFPTYRLSHNYAQPIVLAFLQNPGPNAQQFYTAREIAQQTGILNPGHAAEALHQLVTAGLVDYAYSGQHVPAYRLKQSN